MKRSRTPRRCVRAARHQALGDQTVHPPRHRAWRRHDTFRQVGHAERSIRGPGKTEEDVVRGQRQAVLPAQVIVELLGDVVVGVEQRLPCTELMVGELGHGSSLARRHLQLQASSAYASDCKYLDGSKAWL